MKQFVMRILHELKDPLNVIVYVVVLLLFFSPAIVGYILSFVNPWHLTWANAYLLFWAGPFTPAIPIQLAITFTIARALRRLINYCKMRRAIRLVL